MGFQTFLKDPRQTPNMKMVVESGIKDSRSQKRPKSSTMDDDIESVLYRNQTSHFYFTLKSSTKPQGQIKEVFDDIPVAVFNFGWRASFLMIQVTWRLSCEFWTPIRWLIFIIYRTWIFWLNVQFAQGTNPLWVYYTQKGLRLSINGHRPSDVFESFMFVNPLGH